MTTWFSSFLPNLRVDMAVSLQRVRSFSVTDMRKGACAMRLLKPTCTLAGSLSWRSPKAFSCAPRLRAVTENEKSELGL